MENFNLAKERHKIKIKDLKNLNAPTYISHHKKRREGSSSDLFLKNYYTYFSPLVLWLTLSNKQLTCICKRINLVVYNQDFIK